MQELIHVATDSRGEQVVSARDLHEFLESKQEFSNWIKGRISKYGLIEGQDFITFDRIIKRSKATEYALTIDAAKELAMVEGNDKGKQARQYFIQCEKQLRQTRSEMDELDMMEANIRLIRQQRKELNEVKQQVHMIDARTTTRPDYFTIAGYAVLHKISIGMKAAARLGLMAKTLCQQRGIEVESTPDPRFGRVGMYPKHILDEVFDMPVK